MTTATRISHILYSNLQYYILSKTEQLFVIMLRFKLTQSKHLRNVYHNPDQLRIG